MKSPEKNNQSIYQMKKEELQREFVKTRDNLAQTETELEEYKKQLQQTTTSFEDLKEELKSKEADLEEAAQEIEALKQLKEGNEKLKRQLQTAEEKASKQIAEAKRETEKAARERAVLEERVRELEKGKADLEEKLALAKQPEEAAAEPQPIGAEPIKAAPTPPEMDVIIGELRLVDLQTIPVTLQRPRAIIPHDQSFLVRTTLDLTDVEVEGDVCLACKVSIYAKRIGNGLRQVVGEVRGTYALTDKIQVDAKATALPTGTYRIQAVADISPRGKERAPHLISMESVLRQVS